MHGIVAIMKERHKTPLVGFYNYTVALTYLGAAAGLLGVFAAVDGKDKCALLCLLLAGGCDLFDGLVARTRQRTEQEKRFGVQIDSLADLISFGVLPAAIGYRLGMRGAWLALLCVYALCALIRLAYYNVTADAMQAGAGERRTAYEGLPVTTAALVFPLMATVQNMANTEAPYLYGGAMLLMSAAFVLRFRVTKPGVRGMAAAAAAGLAVLLLVLLRP